MHKTEANARGSFKKLSIFEKSNYFREKQKGSVDFSED
jgi:hypothetical protein